MSPFQPLPINCSDALSHAKQATLFAAKTTCRVVSLRLLRYFAKRDNWTGVDSPVAVDFDHRKRNRTRARLQQHSILSPADCAFLHEAQDFLDHVGQAALFASRAK